MASRIIDGLLGEHIYISKLMHPNMVIFYRDKKIIKTEEISNVTNNIKIIAESLNCLDSDYTRYVLDNILDIQEVVFNKNGLIRFSLKPKGE
jgi:hypothetical protein